MDEIQLMGSGLATTAQLEAFRGTLGTAIPVRSIWMSATMQREWLNTIDFADASEDLDVLQLSDDDNRDPYIERLRTANKSLERSDCPADKPGKIAEMILDAHRRETRTLVVVNTVKRAVELYQSIREKRPDATLALVHSRFRPADRIHAMEMILAPPGKHGSICVSTQVVEAGVDVSATMLITDLAPWSSLVQRFGRCNRYGLDDNARVIWLDIDLSAKGAALPYTEEELTEARAILNGLPGAAIYELPPVSSTRDHRHVLRRKDFIELFDTTPDLSGMDIDVSRFIREVADHDVHVFWREIGNEGLGDGEPAPSREELCNAPIADLKALEGVERWRWDHLEKRWMRASNIAPGMVLMLRRNDGRYNSELGWTGNKDDLPDIIQTSNLAEEADGDDYYATTTWQTLMDHTEAVVRELGVILSQFSFPDEEWRKALIQAARWHDAGKAHAVAQNAFLGDPPEADPSAVWAKTARRGVRYERKGFRHELASALAMLENGLPDLAAYLAASHHGKVRLSIRSLPHEPKPDDPDTRFARGIWDGDVLRETNLGGGEKLPETVLNLSFMEFGDGPHGPSWLARMLSLRDDPALGPLGLSFLEALLRAADWRASQGDE
jgi:CRISPR-associated endonuclease/helicase Cas3